MVEYSLWSLSILCSIIASSSASPVPPRRDIHILNVNGASYLVAILIICCLLALMFLAKCAFVSRRRKLTQSCASWTHGLRKTLHLHADHSSTGSLKQPSLMELSAKDYPRNSKSAFFVGLFGSPSWETRHSVTVENKCLKGSDSYFQLSLPGHFYMVNPNKKKKHSLSASFLSRCNAHSERFRNLKAKSRPTVLALLTPPLATRSSVKRQRHDFDLDFGLRSLLPRVSRSYMAIDHHGCKLATCSSPDSSQRGNSPPCIRPRIPSPFAACSVTTVPEPAFFSTPSHHKSKYLSPCNDRKSQDSERIVTWDFKDSDESDLQYLNFSPFESSIRTVTVPSPETTQSLNDGVKKQENSNIDSLVTGSRLTSTCTSIKGLAPNMTSPEIQRINIIGEPETGASLKKPQQHKKTVSPPLPPPDRPRRSPKVGPSPLRTEYIPTDNDTSMTERALDSFMKEQSPHSPAFFPNLDSEKEFSNDSNSSREPSAPRKIFSDKESFRALKKSRSDNLTKLMEELLEETSEWDASLFVDENFKALMNMNGLKIPTESKLRTERDQTPRLLLPLPAHRISSPLKGILKRRQTSFIHLEDIPEIDVLDSESEQGEYNKDTSFWDEDEFQIGVAR